MVTNIFLDPESAHEVLQNIQAALTAVAKLNVSDLETAVRDVEKFDAFAPFADPTLYLRRREDNQAFGVVVKALLQCRREIDPYAHKYGGPER